MKTNKSVIVCLFCLLAFTAQAGTNLQIYYDFGSLGTVLPQSLVELYDNNALTGDEMGLFAYLPFEEQYTNPNGIIEQRFSINDRRTFKDANGNVVNKIVPLVMTNDQSPMTNFADQANNAPIKSKGVLNKLYFNWAFNNDELLINILNKDAEVNKQSIYVTVRDVEDLNGNPMSSPVTWTAFVDRNSLKWSAKKLIIKLEDNADANLTTNVDIINQSGKRHSYTIESLPSWLTVSTTYGTLDPLEEQTVRLTFNSSIAIGEYSDIVYLTDEDGLSEPLHIEYVVEAVQPFDEIDDHKYPYNMSVCAQVKIGEAYDTDENDIVYAFYRNECVGMEHVSFDAVANQSNVYLTVFGNDDMHRKAIRFRLWQASTGKLFDLAANQEVLFTQGAVYNCGSEQPLILATTGSETQTVELNPGWNWVSFNLDLRQYVAKMEKIMTVNEPWTEGDLIKNPATRHFVIYSDSLERFTGDFDYLRYIYTYMVYCVKGNTVRIAGEPLPEDSMYVTLQGNGQWSALPCLFEQTTPLTEALAGYYQDATPGDLIKARNRFATFTENKRWEGNLTALRPGEGYFFRRLAPGAVDIAFQKPMQNAAPSRKTSLSDKPFFSNPKAATNMTMIAKVEGVENASYRGLEVYVGDELAAVAEPMDSLYFITIQSDQVGELRFERNGEQLTPNTGAIGYTANAHHGSVKDPIILKPADETGVYKIIENNHVIIIRNNEKFSIVGTKL